MRRVRTEPDGTVTEQWAGREIRNAYRGFWHKGVPQYETTLRVRVLARDTAQPGTGYRSKNWLQKYRTM